MPNQKISQDPNAVTLVGDELIPMVQGGVNVKATPEQVSDYVEAQVASAISAKADTSYVNSQNAAQDAVIAGKADASATTAALATKAAITYVDSQNSAQDAVIAGKADTSYVDSQNSAQDALIADKADTTYVDSENAAQDGVIATKAATSYVDSENAAQDVVIAGKADTSYVDSENAAQDAVIADKADTTYVDAQIATRQPLDAQLTSLSALVYATNGGKVIAVNMAENAFELVAPSGGGGLLIDDPSPTLGTNMNANNFDISQVRNLGVDDTIYLPGGGVGHSIRADDGASAVLTFVAGAVSSSMSLEASDINISVTGTVGIGNTNSATTVQIGSGDGDSTISFNTNTIQDVANPVNAQDAATKDYVDTAVAGAGGGAVELLSITNLSGSSQLISLPAGYDMFEAVVVGLKINTDGRVVRGRFRRTAGAVDTNNNYTRHEQSIYSSAQQTLSADPTDGMNLTRSQQDLGINAVMSGKFSIYRPADASVVCWNWQGAYAFIAPTDGPIINTGGMYNNGGVIIDAFEISTAAAAFNAGKVFLYGYKNSI